MLMLTVILFTNAQAEFVIEIKKATYHYTNTRGVNIPKDVMTTVSNRCTDIGERRLRACFIPVEITQELSENSDTSKKLYVADQAACSWQIPRLEVKFECIDASDNSPNPRTKKLTSVVNYGDYMQLDCNYGEPVKDQAAYTCLRLTGDDVSTIWPVFFISTASIAIQMLINYYS